MSVLTAGTIAANPAQSLRDARARRGLADYPDWAYDVAEEVYGVCLGCDPDVAADPAFGLIEHSADPAKRVFHSPRPVSTPDRWR